MPPPAEVLAQPLLWSPESVALQPMLGDVQLGWRDLPALPCTPQAEAIEASAVVCAALHWLQTSARVCARVLPLRKAAQAAADAAAGGERRFRWNGKFDGPAWAELRLDGRCVAALREAGYYVNTNNDQGVDAGTCTIAPANPFGAGARGAFWN